jgi:hypothetical protein
LNLPAEINLIVFLAKIRQPLKPELTIIIPPGKTLEIDNFFMIESRLPNLPDVPDER